MALTDDVYYLDTSALVKRYVSEPGSGEVDDIFSRCYRGLSKISFSYWNIAEASVVFDKYGMRLGLNTRKLMLNLLREVKTLTKLRRLMIVEVSPRVLRETIKFILKYHIYVADAIQIASAIKVGSRIFVTGDKDLARVAEAEKLEVIYIG